MIEPSKPDVGERYCLVDTAFGTCTVSPGAPMA